MSGKYGQHHAREGRNKAARSLAVGQAITPKTEAVEGILLVTNKLFEQGLIRPIRSPHNTPILPI